MKKLIILCVLFSSLIVSAQVNFTSSNLPIFVINTFGQPIPNEPKITAHMGIIFNGEGNINSVSDPFNEYDGMIGIELRGSSSLSYPKNSYAVETRNIVGNDSTVSILGFPEEEDWVLYAPYADKSLLRNVLAYNIANELGRYASRTHFCELVLNGEYLGIYVFMEKIKRDNNRVNIKKLDPEDISGDAVTGGYIIKIDKTDGANNGGWISPFVPFPGTQWRVYFQYHYPKPTDIVIEQEQYIQAYFFDFEEIMLIPFNTPFNGYYDYIDVDSFIDYVIACELPKNIDSYRLSTFLVKDRDSQNDQLQAGPIWDFNFAFGNADYYAGWTVTDWQIEFIDFPVGDAFVPPFWWKELFSDTVFKNKLSRRWFELRQNIITEERIFNYLDSLSENFTEARIRNFQQWQILGTYVWPNAFIGENYEEELNYLKSWTQNRIFWIDGNLDADYSIVDWIDPETMTIEADSNETIAIPVNSYYTNIQNVEYLTFSADDLDLSLILNNDTLYISAASEGVFHYKGLAWRNGAKVEISPPYLFLAGDVVKVNDNLNSFKDFRLYQNYPNPFNSETKIKYSLPAGEAGIANFSSVTLKLYNVLGSEIATLVDDVKAPGNYSIIFNASNLSSGIYYYRLEVCTQNYGRNLSKTKKLILLK